MKRDARPLIPYHPLSCGQVHQMRELLPHMVQFLRAQEHKVTTARTARPDRATLTQSRAA